MTGPGWSVKPYGRGEMLVHDAWRKAPHAFTGKPAALVGAPVGAGFDRESDFEANAKALVEPWGIPRPHLLRLRQVHSDKVVVVEDFADPFHDAPETEGDALVTAETSWALAVLTADCVPILLHDPARKAAAAVHAGWRGTLAGVGAKTVAVMRRRFGCEAANIRALIGPAAGGARYEVDAPVAGPLREAYGGAAESCLRPSGRPERWLLDLKKLNALLLAEAGLRDVAVSEACTIASVDRWYSFRVEGARTGRNIAAVAV